MHTVGRTWSSGRLHFSTRALRGLVTRGDAPGVDQTACGVFGDEGQSLPVVPRVRGIVLGQVMGGLGVAGVGGRLPIDYTIYTPKSEASGVSGCARDGANTLPVPKEGVPPKTSGKLGPVGSKKRDPGVWN